MKCHLQLAVAGAQSARTAFRQNAKNSLGANLLDYATRADFAAPAKSICSIDRARFVETPPLQRDRWGVNARWNADQPGVGK
jgi:hypothetical protein